METPSKALNGRRAIVTGASAGIGEAIARALAGAGAAVVINARRADRLAAVADGISRAGGRVACVGGDAAEASTIERMLEVCRAQFGGEADLVVVNAGRGLRGSVYDSDPAQWEEVFRVNVHAAARLMRAAAEAMIGVATPQVGAPPAPKPPAVPGDWPASARDIIVLGSTVGRNLSPFSSMYGSAKAAVHMLTESLRRTCGPRGVRVTVVEPGIVASEFQSVAGYDPVSFGAFMKSIEPVLTPEDVARVVVFVATQPAGVHINEVMMRPTRQEYP